ncbi:hypothetical protein [Bacillus sp. KH172YL63]|uniref:hypothetical protein n=1 Tax=Bacillus sp. KH172YL63 TaxID=2709784 RepID=UPI0013E4A158|nr:hypothetical protein [Bacillus sp. KH172YL63]BCB06055.1 hypothetical protein KH172YL63_41880 [Bacillus sp. KH172YL63]
MFFNKKETKENLFCIAIFPEKELSDEEYDNQSNKILDAAEENVVVVTEIEPQRDMIEELQMKFPQTKIEVPSYGVYKFDSEKLDEETKKMEKMHKWKKFFNNIHPDEYLIVEHKVMYDMNQILFYTTDINKVISYIHENKKIV